jgi:thiol-disulfide isomerase/thioredoxin
MATSGEGGALRALWIVALSALAGLGAVYVITSPYDNVALRENAKPATAKPDAHTGSMAAFVKHPAPEALPDITIQDAQGNDVKLSTFKGKTILLNLWATWCVPCREEMPALDRLQKDMGSDKFQVVALSLDRQGYAASRKFLDDLKATSVKLYADPSSKEGMALKIVGMPTTLLINKDGLEYGRLAGPAPWDSADAKKIITAAMN